MGDWYSIGVFAGLGVALGVAAAAVFGGRRFALARATDFFMIETSP